jgi:hypothetical protein
MRALILVDEGESVAAAAGSLAIEADTARRLCSMCAETAHKRAMPPIADVGERRRRPAADAE